MDNEGKPSPAEREVYERSWGLILHRLLDWPEDRAAAWARDRIERDGDSLLLLHEFEAWYLHRELISPELRATLGARVNAFGSHLDCAIHCRDPGGKNIVHADYDWVAARARIQSLLEQARAGIDPDDMR